MQMRIFPSKNAFLGEKTGQNGVIYMLYNMFFKKSSIFLAPFRGIVIFATKMQFTMHY